ncbi:MAG: MBL fold metallo-hydrolase [Deltaproteobacteria bacterium]|nr:MAG: MBL fold metallo-hydrolase [Deltaproteobacteria bacterium]
MRVFAFTCGWLSSDLGLILGGESGTARLPIPAYLIQHPRGTVLFDSGMHPDLQTDPMTRLGPVVGPLFAVEFTPGEEIGARLAAVDIDPATVTHLVNSHLHFDHTGGNAQIPNARVVVQTSVTRSISSTASTTSSATAASCACRRTVIHPAINRCGCGSTTGRRSSSPPTRVICGGLSRISICRATRTTATRCSTCCGDFGNGAPRARVSSSVTMRSSGRRCRRRRAPRSRATTIARISSSRATPKRSCCSTSFRTARGISWSRRGRTSAAPRSCPTRRTSRSRTWCAAPRSRSAPPSRPKA